jgi:hypothetical protein
MNTNSGALGFVLSLSAEQWITIIAFVNILWEIYKSNSDSGDTPISTVKTVKFVFRLRIVKR